VNTALNGAEAIVSVGWTMISGEGTISRHISTYSATKKPAWHASTHVHKYREATSSTKVV